MIKEWYEENEETYTRNYWPLTRNFKDDKITKKNENDTGLLSKN